MVRAAAYSVLVLAVALPAAVFCQKAYDAVNYWGKLPGKTISLTLGNGYPAATKVTLQERNTTRQINFFPESGETSASFILRSALSKRSDYFVLKDLQDIYEHPPVIINAEYDDGKKKTIFKFYIKK